MRRNSDLGDVMEYGSPANQRLAFIIFLAVGTTFFVIGHAIAAFVTHYKSLCTESVTAIVVDEVTDNEGLKSPVYLYEFEGKEYQVRNNTYYSRPPYGLGEEAPLKINPDDPRQFYLDKKEIFSINFMFRIMGLIFAGLGVVGLVALRIKRLQNRL